MNVSMVMEFFLLMVLLVCNESRLVIVVRDGKYVNLSFFIKLFKFKFVVIKRLLDLVF